MNVYPKNLIIVCTSVEATSARRQNPHALKKSQFSCLLSGSLSLAIIYRMHIVGFQIPLS